MWDAERIAKYVGSGVTVLCIAYLAFGYESPETPLSEPVVEARPPASTSQSGELAVAAETTTSVAETQATTPPTAGATQPGLALAAADPAAAPTEPVGVYRQGTVILGGSVPDEEVAEAYARRLGAVFGEDAITMHMAVDPRVSGSTLRIDIDERLSLPIAGSAFGPAYASLLELATTALPALPEATLVLEGHTDGRGDEATNLALSRAGAQLAAQWLVDNGVPAERLVTRGAGPSSPIADDGTAEGRAQNRRITASLEGVTPR